MKRFLIKSIYFGCLLIVLLLLIEISLFSFPNDFNVKNEYLEKHINDIDVLFMGHSHVENGVNPQLISQNAFNYGSGGRNIKYDSELLKRYIPRMKKLKLVVYPIAYDFQYLNYNHNCLQHNATADLCWGLNSTYRCMYLKYCHIPYDTESYFRWSELLNSKLDTWGRFVGSTFGLPEDTERYKGWHPLTDRNEEWAQQQLPFGVNVESEEAEAALKENSVYMNEIAEVCKKYNIPLLLVTFPCYETFRKHTTKAGMQRMFSFVKQVTDKYLNVSYRNYMDDDRFVTDDFYNSSHLGEKGADKFSCILRGEIQAFIK